MLDSKLGRVFAVCAIAATTTVSTVPLARPVSAATPHIKCSALAGDPANGMVLSHCTGDTGQASMPFPETLFGFGGTITWVNGKTTTVNLSATPHGSACPPSFVEYRHTGIVTADTTGSTSVGSAVRAHTCLRTTDGVVTMAPGTKATI